MSYTVTIGKMKEPRQKVIGGDSEYNNSLVILIDKLLRYLPVKNEMQKLIVSVLPRDQWDHLRRLCNEGLDEEEKISRDEMEKTSPHGFARLLQEAAAEGGAVKIRKLTQGVQECFYRAYSGKDLEDHLSRRACELMSVFDVNEAEVRLLAYLYLVETATDLDDIACSNSISEFYSLTAAVLDLSVKTVRSALSERGNLINLGLIEPDFLPPPHFQVDEAVKRFFHTGFIDVFLENLHEVKSPVFPLDTFSVSRIQRETVVELVDSPQPVQLLVYGVPGTGKTEFARSVVQSSLRRGYFLSSVDMRGGGKTGSRILQLQAISRKLDHEKSILIVDEADHLLNSETLFSAETEKGWITDFIDNSKVPIIWISNSVEETHPAVLRRFTYSLKFRATSARSREKTWKTLVQQHGLAKVLDGEMIRSLSREYRINVGGIASALNAAARVYEGRDFSKETLVGRLRELLGQHQQLVGLGTKRDLKPLSPSYDPYVLNTDIAVDRILSALDAYTKRQRRLGNSGGPDYLEALSAGKGFPLNLLFWGEPGTGKTEFAKYLAEYVDRPLHLHRASSLLSKWVGETESNIDSAFREAEEAQAVLFLDEADSFFISRGAGSRSWETSQTNELLTQMENYGGILICSTNLLETMDHAVMRRFTWKVCFRSLTTESRRSLYRQLFEELCGEMTEAQRGRLEKMEGLTPGDFYTVQSRMAFGRLSEEEPAGFGDSAGKGVAAADLHDELLAALEQELFYRRRGKESKIGFLG